jgi:competence protein ComEA
MTEKQNLSVNVNNAKANELIAVPGIGPSLAKRIIEKRPYVELHDLVEVSGINELKLAALLPYLTIEKPRKSETKAEEYTPKTVDTEAFLFLEDQKEKEDALLIIFGGFILGLILLLLRRRSQ